MGIKRPVDVIRKEFFTMKFKASLPTVLLEAIMLPCAIDAIEGRHVAVTALLRAFYMQ